MNMGKIIYLHQGKNKMEKIEFEIYSFSTISNVQVLIPNVKVIV